MLGPPLRSFAGSFAPGRAARVAEGWWASVTSGGGVVVPDGAIDLMWCPGRLPWLAGPDTGPHPVAMPAGLPVMGVRLRPGVASAVVRGSVELIADQRVPLDSLAASKVVAALSGRLADASSAGRRAQVLANGLEQLVGDDWSADLLVTETVAALRAGRCVPNVGLSARQQRRRFAAAMGYGPKLYERICRLDRLSDLLVSGRPLAELAVEAGYFDQAHLTRDCVALTGCTPAALRAGDDRSVQDSRRGRR